MADPISIIGLVVTIGQVVSTLYDYGSSVKDARRDINKLSVELFALQGTLQHVDTFFGGRMLEPASVEVLKSTKEFIECLLRDLEIPRSKLKKALQSLRWPLEEKDMTTHLARLERVKSWLILVFMTGTAADTSEIHSEIHDLSRQLHGDIEARRQIATRRNTVELLRWLAPIDPEAEQSRVLQIREPGSRRWFVEGPLTSWLSGSRNRILCLQGKCE